MFKTIVEQILQEILAWLKKLWFESKLKARLKMIEIENQIEAERELEEHFTPLYTEEPVDPELQPGESAKLGGAMRLTAKWHNKEKINNTDESV
jgi:hypothetical protein